MARKEPPKAEIPEWVVTYGDMMSLLLCFFILLAAFSELKKEEEYQEVVDGIKDAFGFSFDNGRAAIDGEQSNSNMTLLDQIAQQDAAERSEDASQKSIEGNEQMVTAVNDSIRSTIGGALTFAPGSAELAPHAKESLKRVAPMLRGLHNITLIRGHAWGAEDKAPGMDLVDLSFKRAKAVTGYLVQECGLDPMTLRPVAVGNNEPRKVSGFGPTDQSANRRVQIQLTEVRIEQVHPDHRWTGVGTP